MERGMTADRLWASLMRYKKLILTTMLAVIAVGAAVVAMMPSVYQSTVVIRVATHTLGDQLVQRTVSERVEERLVTVRQELLSRPLLERAIGELNLYPDIVKTRGIETAVERMRADLDVKVEGENAFELTYRAANPHTAQKVAEALPKLFADEAVKTRTAQAKRATELFANEVEVLKTLVSDWEQKIAQFKIDHRGELPEQVETNMRALERIGGLMQMKSEELRVAEGRRSELARAGLAADSEAGRLKSAENTLNRELIAAKTQWTSDHPELARMQKEVGALTNQRKEAEGRMWTERQERSRSAAAVTRIEKEMEELQKQAQDYQARLDKTPEWTHALAVLNRDYEIARTKYQSVISRKVEAELAETLEAKAAPSMFQVVSPASLPTRPAKPDRLGGLALVVLLSLGLGLLMGVVLEMRDESIRDVKEIQGRVPLPVLAVVPPLETRVEKRQLTSAMGAMN